MCVLEKLLFKTIVLPILFLLAVNGETMGQDRLCICFNEDSNLIEIDEHKSTALTRFYIVREGYETEEQRSEALEEYHKGPPTEDRKPNFYITFFATKKPQVMSLKIRQEKCAKKVSINDIRKNDFQWPKGVRNDLFVLIWKKNNKEEIFWEVALEPIE